MKYTIKEIVTNKAVFSFLRCGIVYYEILVNDTVYTVPVPLSDIGNATLNKEEKGLLLMRYIRKGLESGSLLEDGTLVNK